MRWTRLYERIPGWVYCCRRTRGIYLWFAAKSYGEIERHSGPAVVTKGAAD